MTSASDDRAKVGGDASSAREPRRRVLDPVARNSEVLFGLIMVLTFTSSVSAAEGDRREIRTLLYGAIGCNVAWGIVDAVMYLMAELTERGRNITLLRAVQTAEDAGEAHRLIRGSLPSKVAAALAPKELESIRRHLRAAQTPSAGARFHADDFLGAGAVFLLVFLSTFPVVVPFVFMTEVNLALRVSNAVAIAMLFVLGYRLGKHAGARAWAWGSAMVLLGVVLVAITIALGG
jgi:VIT1/CCC1 family predicted Fe2+/Mn2+ transporter